MGQLLYFLLLLYCSTNCMEEQNQNNDEAYRKFEALCTASREKEKKKKILLIMPNDTKNPRAVDRNDVEHSLVLRNVGAIDEETPIQVPFSLSIFQTLQPLLKNFSSLPKTCWLEEVNKSQRALQEEKKQESAQTKGKIASFLAQQQEDFELLGASSYLSCRCLEKIFSGLLAQNLLEAVEQTKPKKIHTLLLPYKKLPSELSCKIAWQLLEQCEVPITIRDAKRSSVEIKNKNDLVRCAVSSDGTKCLLSETLGSKSTLIEVTSKTSTKKKYHTLRSVEHGAPVSALCFSPYSERYAIASADGIIFVGDIEKEDFLYRFEADKANSLCLNDDDSLLASGIDQGEVILWDLIKGSREKTIKNGSTEVTALCFHPQQKHLLLCGDANGGVRLWDIQQVESVNELGNFKSAIVALSYHSKGDLLGISTKSNGISIIAADTSIGTLSKNFKAEEGYGGIVCFGDTVLALDKSGTVEFWNIKKNRCIQKSKFAKPLAGGSFDKTGKKFTGIVANGMLYSYDFTKNLLETKIKSLTVEQALIIGLACKYKRTHNSILLCKHTRLQKYYDSLSSVPRNFIQDAVVTQCKTLKTVLGNRNCHKALKLSWSK